MPRLLNINSYHYRRGGADAVYFDHAQLMQGLGWDTAYWAMHHPKNLPSEWSPYFVDEIEFGSEYSLSDKLAKAGKVVWSLEAQQKLKRLIADFKPDIAHLHNIYHHLSPSILSTLKQAGIPVVLTAHDLKIACPNYTMYTGGKICERCKGGNYLNTIKHRCIKGSLSASTLVTIEAFTHRLLGSYQRHVDRIVVPSQFFKHKFVEWGWPADRFEYIPNWIDAGQFQPQTQPGSSFLFFGRLDATKGLGTLIRACASAKVELKLAGTGPFEQEARALAQSLNYPVEFLGFQQGQALHDHIRQARAVVLPSEWYENAPISILEALALGKPVIGSDIAGIPEMVHDGQHGWLFPAMDEAALTRRLGEVAEMSDEALTAAGERGRQFVIDQFSQARYEQGIKMLYDDLMNPVPQS